MNSTDLNSSNTINSDYIKHDAIVTKVTNDFVTVSLSENISCAACHAKSACGVSESEDKQIEVYNTTHSFEENEIVTVIMKKSLGMKAVLYAYVLPFFILLATLLIGAGYFSEWLAGLLALGILIPYYTIIYFSSNFLQREFSFSLLKNNK